MKKLLFIFFFPITVPVYLLIKLFGWVKDSFIPFMQYDVIPFMNKHIVSKFKNYTKYKSEQIQENETNAFAVQQNTKQQTIDPQFDLYTEGADEKIVKVQEPATPKISQNISLSNSDVQDMYKKISEKPPTDYNQIMSIGRTEEESLYLGALAVVVYEPTISISVLQRRLKIGYARAAWLLNDFSERLIIIEAEEGRYNCCITKEYFEWLLRWIEENVEDKEKHGFSSEEIDKLFQQYSAQYDNIEYNKDSKIVSIFTKKWREICRHEFIALDFETTGLNYKNDRIIEVAAIKYVDGLETDKMVTLVNPLMHIHSDATAVNHITDDMVANAPTERSIIPQLIEFLGDSLIVGHYVNFDLSFLEVAAQRYGYNVKYNYIDTLSVSKKLFKGLPNYKLGTIADSLHIDTGTLHRAEADVRVCAEIINIALNSLIDDC